MDKPVKTLGINTLSKLQVSRMAAELDEQVDGVPTPALGAAEPFTFVAADALTMKVSEGGRVVNAVCLVATGVNGDGNREVLGLHVTTAETKEARNTFLASAMPRPRPGTRRRRASRRQGTRSGRPCPRGVAAPPTRLTN